MNLSGEEQTKILCVGLMLMIGFGLLPAPLETVSISFFLQHYMENATRLNVVKEELAYIYFNNDSYPSAVMNVSGAEAELNYGLRRHTVDVVRTDGRLIKHPLTSFFETVLMGLMLLLLLSTHGRFRGRHTNCIVCEDHVGVTFDDVAGLVDAKQQIKEFVDFLQHPSKYERVAARLPRGCLLYGPPGCGKTLLAKAVSGETRTPFLSCSGSDFAEMYVGVGPARIRHLFETARKKAPCIIFIDELDAMGRARSRNPTNAGNRELENTLNRLLTELDGFEKNESILVFGATNRLDMLDSALLRPGRFDRQISIELPELQERKAIFQAYLDKMPISSRTNGLENHLAKVTYGFSGADISNTCNEASILAVRHNQTTVTQEMFEKAIDTVLLGPEKTTFRLTDEEKRIVAYHEAGHAVLSYVLEHAQPPIKVSIMPRGASMLGFSQSEIKETKLKSKQELLDSMCVLLGGRVAELLFIKTISSGAADDIKKLTNLAYTFVTRLGMDEAGLQMFHFDNTKRVHSESLSKEVDRAVQQVIQGEFKRAKKCLRNHTSLVASFAEKLLEKETLCATDLDILFSTIKKK